MTSKTYEPSANRPCEPAADRRLRGAKDLTGYHIEGTDGPVGHVKDFVVDDDTWEVRYLVVSTTNWWVGKSVLIAPEWATRMDWLERKMLLGMTRDAIKRSPEWTAKYPVERIYDEQLYQHYVGAPGWMARERDVLATHARARAQSSAASGHGIDGGLVGRGDDRVAAHEEHKRPADQARVIRHAPDPRVP